MLMDSYLKDSTIKPDTAPPDDFGNYSRPNANVTSKTDIKNSSKSVFDALQHSKEHPASERTTGGKVFTKGRNLSLIK